MLTIETKHFAGGAALTGKGAGGKASLQDILEELQNPANATIGDGTAAAALTIDKDGAAAGDVNLKSDGVLRGRIRLTSSETIVIEVFDADAASQGSITIAADGSVTLTDGLTISAGGLTITAGLLTAGGGLTVASGQTLTLTGVSIVGKEEYIPVHVANLVGGDAKVYGFPCPVAGTITSIRSRLGGGALTTGNATITGKIGSTAITDGVITITQSGSAEGDIDSATPSAANVVAVGDNVNFTVGGTNDATSSFADLIVTIRRSA